MNTLKNKVIFLQGMLEGLDIKDKETKKMLTLILDFMNDLLKELELEKNKSSYLTENQKAKILGKDKNVNTKYTAEELYKLKKRLNKLIKNKVERELGNSDNMLDDSIKVDDEVLKNDDLLVDKTENDDLLVDETESDDLLVDETESDDLLVDETESDDLLVDETESDDLLVDETESDDLLVDETESDDLLVDETESDDLLVDETESDDLLVDETESNDLLVDETESDDLLVDVTENDNLLVGEAASKDIVEPNNDLLGENLKLETKFKDESDLESLNKKNEGTICKQCGSFIKYSEIGSDSHINCPNCRRNLKKPDIVDKDKILKNLDDTISLKDIKKSQLSSYVDDETSNDDSFNIKNLVSDLSFDKEELISFSKETKSSNDDLTINLEIDDFDLKSNNAQISEINIDKDIVIADDEKMNGSTLDLGRPEITLNDVKDELDDFTKPVLPDFDTNLSEIYDDSDDNDELDYLDKSNSSEETIEENIVKNDNLATDIDIESILNNKTKPIADIDHKEIDYMNFDFLGYKKKK